MDKENICCGSLNVLPCGDTEEHNHFLCDSQYVLEGFVLGNDWVREVCLGKFMECKYCPKGED